jgi:hypothetical protein
MNDESPQDKPAPRPEGRASRLPWRYAEIGRRRLAAIAAGRTAAAGSNGRSRGAVDIDDHIRLAVREESAATLGRAGRRLKEAVAALADFDRDFDRDFELPPEHNPRSAAGRGHALPARGLLLNDAARALWEYVVQREAVGLTNHESLEQFYGVTPELWRLMGSAEVVCEK